MSSTEQVASTRLSRLLRECERLLDTRKYGEAARLLSAVCLDYQCAVQVSYGEHGHSLKLIEL